MPGSDVDIESWRPSFGLVDLENQMCLSQEACFQAHLRRCKDSGFMSAISDVFTHTSHAKSCN